MADLPMAQVPNFQTSSSPVPYQGNLGTGLAAGLQQATNAFQQQQVIAQKQQEIQMAKQQQMIEKNMKMLETGSDMMLSGGPEVQETGKSLIQQAYPFLTGQPLPQGMPLDKDAAKDLGYFMDQHRTWQQTQGKEGLSAQDAVTGATQAMSRYGMKYQNQQMGLLEKSPMYKEAMADQTGGLVNGQPATQNSFTGAVSSPNGQAMPPGAAGSFIPAAQAASIQNTNQNNAASEFQDLSKDQKEILDNGTSFLNMLSPRLPDNATPEQKNEFALHDKQAVLKYIQMQVPSSKRPPNMTMEDLAKSSLLTQQAKDAYNQAVVNGSPLDNDLRDALLKTGGQTILNNEGILSGNESGVANRAIRNGVDPSKAITNLRPSGIPSTSKLFPSQGASWQTAQAGQIVQGKSGPFIYRGGDKADPNNWTLINK